MHNNSSPNPEPEHSPGQDSQNSNPQTKQTGLNLPARALLEALKEHYACQAKAGEVTATRSELLNEKEQQRLQKAHIRSLLEKKMDAIFDALSQCESCARHVEKVLIDHIDIDDIPHELLLESVRLRARLLFDVEERTHDAPE